MAKRLPPVWVIMRGPSSVAWPGIVQGAAPDDPAPNGWEYVYDRFNVLKYANDGSPYITNGSETISLDQYYARGGENPYIAPVIASVSISNTAPETGDVLTASVVFSQPGNPTPTVTYAWYAGASLVGTMASYVVQSADIGDQITLTVEATNLAGSSQVTSAPTDPVIPPPFLTAGQPIGLLLSLTKAA